MSRWRYWQLDVNVIARPTSWCLLNRVLSRQMLSNTTSAFPKSCRTRNRIVNTPLDIILGAFCVVSMLSCHNVEAACPDDSVCGLWCFRGDDVNLCISERWWAMSCAPVSIFERSVFCERLSQISGQRLNIMGQSVCFIWNTPVFFNRPVFKNGQGPFKKKRQTMVPFRFRYGFIPQF